MPTPRYAATGYPRSSPTRAYFLGGLLLLAAACSRGGQSDEAADTIVAADTTRAAGSVDEERGSQVADALATYEITDDRYQRWLRAQRALDALPDLPSPPRVEMWDVTQADFDRAIAFLEREPRARAAIDESGLSVRDYVLTSIALNQALVVTNQSRTAPGRRVPPRNAAIVKANRDTLADVVRDMRFRVAADSTPPASNTESLAADSAPTDSTIATATGSVSRVDTAAAPVGIVPPGTTIALRSDDRICTNTSKVGDRFTATVTSPVTGTNDVEIPAGAKAALTVTRLERSDNITDPIRVGFRVGPIHFGGRTYALEASTTSAEVDRVRTSTGARDAHNVLAGAVVGAIAGQVLGRNTKSTVAGAAAGAVAGAAASEATAKYDGCVPVGGEIRITLQEAVRIRT